MPPPARAAMTAWRVLSCRAEQRQEQRGERCVEPEPFGVAERAAADDADHGAEHPEHVERQPRAEEHASVERPVRAARTRPTTRRRPPATRRRGGTASRGRAARPRSRSRRTRAFRSSAGDDRGCDAAALVQDRHDCELRRAAERRRRHHDRQRRRPFPRPERARRTRSRRAAPSPRSGGSPERRRAELGASRRHHGLPGSLHRRADARERLRRALVPALGAEPAPRLERRARRPPRAARAARPARAAAHRCGEVVRGRRVLRPCSRR